MEKLYIYETSAGAFYIAEEGGRFHPVFQEQSLGDYSTAEEAAEKLAGGHTFSLPGGIDPSDLGVPQELGDWVKITPEA